MKTKTLLLTAVATLGLTSATMAQNLPNYVPSNGLVGWWPFNGNANDESGNNNNGTVNGATLTADRFGNANKAYSFDGVDDYIVAINSPSLDIQGNQYSISSWVYCTIGTQGQIISKSDISNRKYGQYINGNLTELGFELNNSDSYNGQIQHNKWSNLITTYDGNQKKWYIDGQQVHVENYSSNIISNNMDFFIGVFGSLNESFFNNKIDDIGIWNHALTECEIQDLYNAQLGSFSNTTVTVNPTSSSIGKNAILTVSSPISSLQWQSNPGNIGWNNVLNNYNYSGSTNDTLVVSKLQLSNHNQPFRVLACGDTSNIATIQIADTCITNVTVYDTLLTTVTDTLIINTTLSLPAPNNENTILIYPNPASDHITIYNGNFAAMIGYSIKITNNAGQEVFLNAINQAQFYVDLSTWSGNGLYFVHLIDPQNNTVTVKKIVLQ